MTYPTLDQILTSDDRPEDTVDVPEWGGKIRLRTLTAAERGQWFASIYGPEGKLDPATYQARLVAVCTVDLQGKPLFTEDKIHTLSQKSGKVLARVFSAACRHNGIGAETIGEGRKG